MIPNDGDFFCNGCPSAACGSGSCREVVPNDALMRPDSDMLTLCFATVQTWFSWLSLFSGSVAMVACSRDFVLMKSV